MSGARITGTACHGNTDRVVFITSSVEHNQVFSVSSTFIYIKQTFKAAQDNGC